MDAGQQKELNRLIALAKSDATKEEDRRAKEKAAEKVLLIIWPQMEKIIGYMNSKYGAFLIGLDEGDLLTWAYNGFRDALDKFEPARGCQFMTYAASRIKGNILDEMRRHGKRENLMTRHHRDRLKKREETANNGADSDSPDTNGFVERNVFVSVDSLLSKGADEYGGYLLDPLLYEMEKKRGSTVANTETRREQRKNLKNFFTRLAREAEKIRDERSRKFSCRFTDWTCRAINTANRFRF